MFRSIGKRLKIWHIDIVPAYAELFHDSSAAFGESGVAKFAIEFENLAPSTVYSLSDSLSCGTGQSLITLAMIISTDVETAMVLMIIPLHIFLLCTIIDLVSAGADTVEIRNQRRNIIDAFRNFLFV
jgi:hypothetical protein